MRREGLSTLDMCEEGGIEHVWTCVRREGLSTLDMCEEGGIEHVVHV